MKRFFTRHKILASISLVLAVQILILSFQVRDSSDRPLIAGFVALILTPAQSAADISLKWIADKWNRYVWLRNLEDENRDLRDKISKLEEELALRGKMETRLTILEKLLEFKARSEFITEPAVITGFGSSTQYKTVFINKGSSAGLQKYQPVINNQGLVGIVVLTTPFTAQLQLLTDSNTAASVQTEKSGIRGILTGWKNDFLVINYIDKHEKIFKGERVITNGLDEIYPYGMFVGTVQEIDDDSDMFLKVIVKPAVDFRHLDSLLIIKNKIIRPIEQTEPPEEINETL
jgi:rod shape-determining protein MreC